MLPRQSYRARVPPSIKKVFLDSYGITVTDQEIGSGGFGTIFLARSPTGLELAVKGPVGEREAALAWSASLDGIGPEIHGDMVSIRGPNRSIEYYYAAERLESTLEDWPRDAKGMITDADACGALEDLAAESIAKGYVHGDIWVHCKNVMKSYNGNVYLIDFGFTRKLPYNDYSIALGQAEWATLFAKCGVPHRHLVLLFDRLNLVRHNELTRNMPPLTELERPGGVVVFSRSRQSAQPVQPPQARPAPIVISDDDNDNARDDTGLGDDVVLQLSDTE